VSLDKHWSFPYTILNDRLLKPGRQVFTARYAQPLNKIDYVSVLQWLIKEEHVTLKCKVSSLHGRPTLHQQEQMCTYKLQDTKRLSVSTHNAWLQHYLTCLPWQGGIYDVCGTNIGLWGGEMFSGSAPTGWGNMHWYVTKVVSKLWRPCWSWCPSCKACNKNQVSSYL